MKISSLCNYGSGVRMKSLLHYRGKELLTVWDMNSDDFMTTLGHKLNVSQPTVTRIIMFFPLKPVYKRIVWEVHGKHKLFQRSCEDSVKNRERVDRDILHDKIRSKTPKWKQICFIIMSSVRDYKKFRSLDFLYSRSVHVEWNCEDKLL